MLTPQSTKSSKRRLAPHEHETEFMMHNSNRRNNNRTIARNQSFPVDENCQMFPQEVNNPFSFAARVPRQFGNEVSGDAKLLSSPQMVSYEEVTNREGIVFLKGSDGKLYHPPSQPRKEVPVNVFIEKMLGNQGDLVKPEEYQNENVEFIGATETVQSQDNNRSSFVNEMIAEEQQDESTDPIVIGEKYAGILSVAESEEEIQEHLADANVVAAPLDLSSVSKAAISAKGEARDLWNALLGIGIYMNNQRNVSNQLLTKTATFAKTIKQDSLSIMNGISFQDCNITVNMRKIISPSSKDFLPGLNLADCLNVIVSKLIRLRYIGTTLKTNGMGWKYLILSLYFKLLRNRNTFPALAFQPSRPKSDAVNVMNQENFATTNAIVAGQYQLGLSSYDTGRLGYGNSYSSSYPSSSLYRPYYNEYSYPIQYSSSYSNGLSRSSPWYSQNTGYSNGYAQYGMGNNYGSMYDNNGYNPLLLNVNQHSSPLEQTSYLNMIHDKENFQPGGCGYDPIQQRCTDGLGLCKGGCRDFSTSFTAGIRDCRCIPYGYAALMKLLTGYKKAKKT